MKLIKEISRYAEIPAEAYKKKTLKLAVMLLSVGSLTGLSQVAIAAETDCTGEIGAVGVMLNDGTADGTYVGICAEYGSLDGARNGERTCDGLNGKLANATTKMEQDKVVDADKKLQNFQDTIDSLAFRRKAKIDSTDYAYLNGSLQIARACVSKLLP